MERFLPGSLHETCPFCGNDAHWSSPAEDAFYVAPSGHTIVWAKVEGMVVETDVCPRDPATSTWTVDEHLDR